MEPTLGMRYETPYQLKLALANYGVAHGYQLWYMKNDWREVLVYCGRNVEEGRCAGKKGNKDMVMKNKVRSGVQTSVKKKVVKKKVLKKKVVKKKPVSDSREGTSQSPKRAKQLALFDHKGGLIEHYGRLYQYRIYICFKGVKDAIGGIANNQMYPPLPRGLAVSENATIVVVLASLH
ncbi:hypothetical protein Tco_0829796 [Tanacetum coccineum]